MPAEAHRKSSFGYAPPAAGRPSNFGSTTRSSAKTAANVYKIITIDQIYVRQYVPYPIDLIDSVDYSKSLEQRRTQRYRLQLPLRIVQLGDRKVNRTEQTRDISSGGVCFLSPMEVEVGDRIEYMITLSGNTPPVRIRCLGKVLRSSRPAVSSNGHREFEVAVTMERYQFVRASEFEVMEATA